MRPPTIYLAGPINGATDEEANGWRQAFMARLPRCGFLDPMVRDYRGREDDCVEEIVQGDKQDILDSDVVLAYAWQQSWGTAMELFYAWDRKTTGGRKIVVVVPEGQRVSPWLRYHSDIVVPTLEKASLWIEEQYGL